MEESFARELDHWVKHGFGWRVAVDKESQERIGFIGTNHLPPDAAEFVGEEAVEIGWWLLPGYWRRGLATEGARALRDEAFGRVGLERIIGRFQPANTASGRIMEAIGMSFERDLVDKHGKELRIYAMNRAKWSNDGSA